MKFDERVDIKHWQNIQDVFSSIIGLSLRTVDQHGEIIARPSNVPAICAEPVSESPVARKKCWQWYPKLTASLNKTPQSGSWQEHVCPLGLENFSIPIAFNNTETVYLIAGPLVHIGSSKDIRITERIRESGIDEQKFFEGFNRLPSVRAEDVGRMSGFLQAIIKFMSSLEIYGHQTDDGGFLFEKEKISNLLKAFLEAAMRLCDAERGSVMVFEKTTQELSIKEATGLSEDIIQTTKLKPGEGLAGLTIERRKAFHRAQ